MQGKVMDNRHMNNRQAAPPGRKMLAIFLLIAGLTVYVVLTVTLTDLLASSDLVKIIIYAIAGIVWIFPARYLLIWMETGRWTIPKQPK
jgi:Protein of unknown function (DUF2842)